MLFIFNNSEKFYFTFNGSVNTIYESPFMLRTFIILQEKHSVFVLQFLVIFFVTGTKFHFLFTHKSHLQIRRLFTENYGILLGLFKNNYHSTDYVCMYACMYVYMYVCMYVRMYENFNPLI